MALTQYTYDDYTVAILCALESDRDAVRYMFDEEHERLPSRKGDPNSYILGELHGHNVVLACLPSQQGKAAAAIVAAHLSRSFLSVKWRLFVGTGGGVPSAKFDIRLGDVVVSMPEGGHTGVIQHDLGRATISGFEPKGFLWPIPSILRNAAQDMHSDHLGRDNKIEEYMNIMFEKWPGMTSYKQPPEADILFPSHIPHSSGTSTCTGGCDTSQAITRPARQFEGPEIHYGLIASGDLVVKNATVRDEISQRFGGVLCFEMEGAGLMSEYPSIVIRGISNYADSHKNDIWQRYAAATAAACAKELLSLIILEAPAAKPALAIKDTEISTGVVVRRQGLPNVEHGNVGIWR
ncbi:nucleoside phosphorylase domain-containing protein [Astrocystis sublimbata]|nr:nucleoside phosphorylase domain-containing protein [Astrocystis sublimbata]